MITSQTIVLPSYTRRKFVLSLGFVAVSTVYVAWQNISTGKSALTKTSGSEITPSQSYKAANEALLQTLSAIASQSATSSPASSPATNASLAVQPVTQPTIPTPTPQKQVGIYINGSYTGNPVDAYYGTVQVKAVIRNGQVADVQFLQHPSDRSTSRYINDQAMPLLAQEAIQAQSAQVDGVSGATFTSQAFQQSLASALVKAKN